MSWKRCLILFVVVIGGMFGALACGDPEVVEVVKEVPIGGEKIITVEVPVEQVRTVTVPVEVIVEKVVTREVTVIVTATPTSTPIPASDPTECLERDEKYLLDLAARFSAFEIYNELAGTTPRMSLANVISKMSDQQIDLISVRPATGCAGAYTRLADWMAKAIDSFSAFLAQKSDSHVVELIDAADQAKQSAALAINEALKSIGQTPILDVEGAAQNAPVSETPSTPPVELVEGSIGFRIQERNNVWWKFAYQFTLRNNTDRQRSLNLEIKFVDSDGFVVDDATAYDVVVPADGTVTHSDSTLIDASEAGSVTGIQIKER